MAEQASINHCHTSRNFTVKASIEVTSAKNDSVKRNDVLNLCRQGTTRRPSTRNSPHLTHASRRRHRRTNSTEFLSKTARIRPPTYFSGEISVELVWVPELGPCEDAVAFLSLSVHVCKNDCAARAPQGCCSVIELTAPTTSAPSLNSHPRRRDGLHHGPPDFIGEGQHQHHPRHRVDADQILQYDLR